MGNVEPTKAEWQTAVNEVRDLFNDVDRLLKPDSLTFGAASSARPRVLVDAVGPCRR